MIPGLKARKFTLHDALMYFAIARKHMRLMALLICFSLMCGLTYYIFARPVYHAVALIHVDNVSRPLDTDKIYRDSHIRYVMMQLTSPPIVERTARALGVDVSYEELLKKHLNKLKPGFDFDYNIVMEVWASSPELADRWTEAMLNEFLAKRTEKRVESRNLLEKTFSAEIKEVLTRIDRQYAEKINFQDERGLTEALIRLKSVNSLPEDLSRLRSDIDEMGRVRIRLQDPALQDDVVAKLSLIASSEDKGDPLRVGQDIATGAKDHDGSGKDGGAAGQRVIVVPSILKSPHPWEGLLQQQQQVKGRIDELSKTFLPTSRKMAEPNKQLAAIQQELDAEYQTAQRRFDLKFQELINEKRDLEGKIPEYNAIRDKHSKLLDEIWIHTLTQLPFKNYLVQMQQKQVVLDYAGEKERMNLQYAGLLEPSTHSISPNRFRLMIGSLAIGLVLSISVSFLIEFLDHTVGNLAQVESTFQMRGLGIVPEIEASSSGSVALISNQADQKDPLIENFRVIRTNVLSMGNLTKKPHVIMVTSSMPKEGKTVVASNLAVSFAQTGLRTLLIDTDLHRGRLHRLFGYRKDPGITNVLLNETSIEDACRTTEQENLWILSSGRRLGHGTELLASPSFRDLMQTLRERYDHIVIDTPPVLGLSETLRMQQEGLVDGVLFVIWTGHTPTRSAKTAVDMLAANGANFYGFVLNRLDLRATDNYYNYYYYSHDYYYQRPLENA